MSHSRPAPPALPRRGGLLAAVAVLSTLSLTGCGLVQAAGNDDTISLIVTESAPYQEPTEIAKELLAEEGWTLETTYVTDIVQPNQVVSQGEYDANFFQHQAYLHQFNQDNGTDVVPAFSVYYAPSGIFSLRHDSIEDLPDGATISLPVDTANNGRGLKLLAEAGALEIDESVPVTELSQADITDNPRDFQFVEIDQQSTAQTLPDVDAGLAFSRLVAEAGHSVEETALILEEDEETRVPYTNVLAVTPENLDSEKTRALQEAYQSPEVEQWYADYLDGALDYVDAITVDTAQQEWEEYTS
ncbi:MetQ/NlpA family ABC transporter substrate-binding protein [Brevibacterium album]|uniref:MetQ/NlpA family ABC transporter substrate-binding protein n=1 Tax=Brevibacterium album TaxID=417948 RepID=UPI000408AC20|nr:MetQ/NlpA family ABC transporter substrate-binding protein [Brevibacterium album]